jgi:hypothetical protein
MLVMTVCTLLWLGATKPRSPTRGAKDRSTPPAAKRPRSPEQLKIRRYDEEL